MSHVCHLLVDPPAQGAWNMAVDEAMLAMVAETQIPILRFYQWQQPTLSLGYFQSNADRATHPASKQAQVVRRLSGGGAIVHDQELTYSLALPQSHPLSTNTQALYQAIHSAMIRVLQTLLAEKNSAWQPILCEPEKTLSPKEEPFLCFERRAQGDVLLRNTVNSSNAESRKIVGSAQRRRQQAVLQHGSLLLKQSPTAPELPGFCNLSSIELSPTSALELLQLAYAEALDFRLQKIEHPEQLLKETEAILSKRYSNSRWLERR